MALNHTNEGQDILHRLMEELNSNWCILAKKTHSESDRASRSGNPLAEHVSVGAKQGKADGISTSELWGIPPDTQLGFFNKLIARGRGKRRRGNLKEFKILHTGTYLVIYWLRFHASTAGGMGSIPDQGTKIPHATWHGQKRKINK